VSVVGAMNADRRAAARLLIAGVASGVGKTTFTAGLASALRRRGLRVATYKCGPDYLDPTYHALASGRACHNLDGYMMGQGAVLETFAAGAPDVDIQLVEGMMGLVDGASATSIEGSSAEIARWLQLPVVWFSESSARAWALGALVLGCAWFEAGVGGAGVGGGIEPSLRLSGHRSKLLAPLLADPPCGTERRRSGVGRRRIARRRLSF